MTRRTFNVLVCEDDLEDVRMIEHEFSRAEFDARCERVETAEVFRASLARQPWDVVLSDYSMPRFSAGEALRLLREIRADTPFIVVTGSIDEETAVATLKLGADDYILKHNLTRLVPAIEAAVRLYESQRESRELEEQLRQAQKLEAVGRLAAGVAHDFNNLLTVIQGYAGLIEADRTSTTIDDGLHHIMDAAGRGSRLTRQLLAFGRQHPSRPRPLDINHVLESLCGLVVRTMTTGMAVEQRFEATRPVHADPVHLEQAFLNLVINARDAMGEGGKLDIITRDVELDPRRAKTIGVEPGGYVCVSVEDRGVGIPEANISKIFEPFFTTRARLGGSGLGLSTTFGIVKQSGGMIRVDSEVGRGTRFDVYLPVTDEPAEAEPASQAKRAEAARAGAKLLLVEDEPAIRSWIAAGLRRHGHEVIEAENGREALEMIERDEPRFDLVICDMTMPELSGPGLRDRLREIGSEVPFLFTSGNPDQALLQQATAGAAFLPKPFGLAELLAQIDSSLGRQKLGLRKE